MLLSLVLVDLLGPWSLLQGVEEFVWSDGMFLRALFA